MIRGENLVGVVRLAAKSVGGRSVVVGPDGAVRGRRPIVLALPDDRLDSRRRLVAVGLRRWRRLRRRQRVVVGRAALVRLAGGGGGGRRRRETVAVVTAVVVALLDREPVAEVGVAEAPASDAVVPRLVATADVVVGQLLHRFERIEAAAVDRCEHRSRIVRRQ